MKNAVVFYAIGFFLLSCTAIGMWRKDTRLRADLKVLKFNTNRVNRIQELMTSSVPIGSTAPSFQLPSFKGGVVSFDPSMSKLSLLIFFNPNDCTWCLLEAALWRDLHSMYADEELRVIGIVTGRNIRLHEVLLFTKGRQLDFPVLRCGDCKLIQAFGLTNTPTRILLDASGRILDAGYSTHGETIQRQLREKIALLLDTIPDGFSIGNSID